MTFGARADDEQMNGPGSTRNQRNERVVHRVDFDPHHEIA
jgi:hypothetical protein